MKIESPNGAYAKRILLSLLVGFLWARAASAQSASVDEYIRAEMQRQHIPGLALAVIKDGRVVKAQGYGLANVETGSPITAETVFKIGSLSKPIIAMGIMLLVEEGKISLEDRASRFLDGTPETWKDISIRNLLSHTSGIVREAPGFDRARIQTNAEVIKTAYPVALGFRPGDKYEYCNVGYFVLAEIIDRVSGQPWSEFLANRIFTPLGMASTRTTTVDEIIPNRSNGYGFGAIGSKKLMNARVTLAVRPCGAFLSTLADLIKLEAALNGKEFLKPETRRAMWTPFRFNNGKDSMYGLGWRVEDINGVKRIGHAGNLDGFKSFFARFPDNGLTIITLTNLDQVEPYQLSKDISSHYIPALGGTK
jgi:D-alanyl-D-alanine carboxypeptidase